MNSGLRKGVVFFPLTDSATQSLVKGLHTHPFCVYNAELKWEGAVTPKEANSLPVSRRESVPPVREKGRHEKGKISLLEAPSYHKKTGDSEYLRDSARLCLTLQAIGRQRWSHFREEIFFLIILFFGIVTGL